MGSINIEWVATDSWTKIGKLKNCWTIFEHERQTTWNGKGEGGKARKLEWGVYWKNIKTLGKDVMIN